MMIRRSTSEIGSHCEEKRVHFENNSATPTTMTKMGLLASLKNTCSSKLEHSSPVKSGSGILTKLHEKLAGTRSSPPISALSNLDVPKLRELKSHSFPPQGFNVQPIITTDQNTNSDTQQIISTDIHLNLDNADAAEETTDERRKRWLLHNHAYENNHSG